MKRSTVLILCLWGQMSLHAESLSTTSAKGWLNAFIATYAKTEVSWKKDVRLNEQPGHLAPGRQLGQGAQVGYYSFVPKIWEDLTEEEKDAVLQDPRLKAYLISCREASAPTVAADGVLRFPIEGIRQKDIAAPKERPPPFPEEPPPPVVAAPAATPPQPSEPAGPGLASKEASPALAPDPAPAPVKPGLVPVVIKISPQTAAAGQEVKVDLTQTSAEVGDKQP